MSQVFVAEAIDKKGEKVPGNDLIVPTGIIRIRFLYRWGLTLRRDNDKTKENPGYLTEYWRGGCDTNRDVSFLPEIPNYEWIRRPVRDGYLYAYNDNEKKMSEYLIADGKLNLVTTDLMHYKSEHPISEWDTREPISVDYEDYWQNNTDDEKNNKLDKLLFAYSECQWSMKYIETLLDDAKEELRGKRFGEIDLYSYYEHFGKLPSTEKNPLKDVRLASCFSLGDHYAYMLKSGNEHNRWEKDHFSQAILTDFIMRDSYIMSPPPPKEIIVPYDVELGGSIYTSQNGNSPYDPMGNSQNNQRPLIIHGTLLDPLGALDDIAEDLAMENARFDALISSLSLPQSPDELLNDALEELGAARYEPSFESLSDEEKIDKLFKESMAESKRNDPLTKDYNKLHTSALILYKLLYSPEYEEAIENDEEMKEYMNENDINPEKLNKKYNKYRKCLQQEKITKLLATEERKEYHKSILKIRDSLGYMLEQINNEVALFDYVENTPYRIAEGKKRMGNVVVQLCNLFRGKDRHLDIINPTEEEALDKELSKWNALIFSSVYYEEGETSDVTLDTFDFDSSESQLMTRALMNTISECKDEESMLESSLEYAKAIGLTFTTQISLFRYLESQIRLDRFQIQNKITTHTDQIQEHTQSIQARQNEIDLSNRKIEKAEGTQAKLEKGIDNFSDSKTIAEKRVADLENLEDQFIKHIEDNILANKKEKNVIERKYATIEELENEISNNSVYAEHAENKNVTMFGKEIEHCNKQITELEEQNRAAHEDIQSREEEITNLEAEKKKVRREKKYQENKAERAETKIVNKREEIKRLNKEIKKHNEKINKSKLEIAEREGNLNKLRNRLDKLKAEHQNLKSFRIKYISVNTKKLISNICNTTEFRNGMLILSFTSLIDSIFKMMDDPSKREAVNLTACIADIASISIDTGLAIKASMKNIQKNPVGARQMRIMARGATKISMGFGVISSIAGTIGVYMDMKAARLKRDERAAAGYAVAVVIGGISALSSFVLVLSSLNAFTLSPMAASALSACHIYGMILFFIIVILVTIFSNDDFETFLKATVFTSSRKIKNIDNYTPFEVKTMLCLQRTDYCTIYNNDLYNVVYISEGQVDEVKEGLDLANFDNMLGWLYNLIVGFSVAALKKGARINTNQGFDIPENINLNVILGGFIEGVSYVDSEFRLFPVGVKKYLKNTHNDNGLNYRPCIKSLDEQIYEKIENYKNVKLGYGFRYNFNIETKCSIFKKNNQSINILMRYVIFFRVKLNGDFYWPYMRNFDKEPIYLALTDTVSGTPGDGGPGGRYIFSSVYSRNGGPGRYNISHKNAVLLGNKTGILEYLSNLESKIIEDRRYSNV